MKNGTFVGLAITSIAAGVAFIASSVIKSDSSQYSYESSERKINEKYSKTQSDISREIVEVNKKLCDLNERESNERSERISKWENETGYLGSMSAIEDERRTRIDDVKNNEIKYNDSVRAIKKEAEDAIEDWKTREDYSNKINEFEKMAKEAKSSYEGQKILLSVSNGNGQNDYLLKAAKEEKNRKLNDINSQKQHLESDLASFSREQKSIADREVRNLKERLDRRVKEIEQDIEKKKAPLYASRTTEMSNIASDVRSMRTDEENGYLSHLYELESKADDLNSLISSETNTLNSRKTSTQKIADLIREKYEWSSGAVIGIGSIPAIVGVAGIAVYMSRVFEIASAVKKGDC